MLMAIALISSVIRYFNLVNNYGITPNIRGVMFPLIGIILIIIRTIFSLLINKLLKNNKLNNNKNIENIELYLQKINNILINPNIKLNKSKKE